MKKIAVSFFLVFFMLSLAGCSYDAVLAEMKAYQIDADIHSLNIQVNAADFIIREADAFSVESNLKYLTVSEENGVLTVIEESKSSFTYTNAVLVLYMPTATVFEEIYIATGAGRLAADQLFCGTLDLHLGAGETRIEELRAETKANITGGAGKITISDGTLKDLNLGMGVGELNLVAALIGSSNLTFGVGESSLTLIGTEDDYALDLEKGLGSITVEGKDVTDYGSSGNGQNRVSVKGGIGAIHLSYREP